MIRSKPTIEQLITSCGQPIAGHQLTVAELLRATLEQRLIEISNDPHSSKVGFNYSARFGLDHSGRVNPNYLVFPRAIPPELRGTSEPLWDSIQAVFDAFGVDIQ
jgi:hypothetical protein